MCYEFGNWFLKARAKELHRAREKSGEADKTPAASATRKPETSLPQTKEPEKAPA